MQEQNVTVMPGSFLGRDTATHELPGGNPGQGHVRVAWVAAKEDCLVAAQRLADFAVNLAAGKGR